MSFLYNYACRGFLHGLPLHVAVTYVLSVYVFLSVPRFLAWPSPASCGQVRAYSIRITICAAVLCMAFLCKVRSRKCLQIMYTYPCRGYLQGLSLRDAVTYKISISGFLAVPRWLAWPYPASCGHVRDFIKWIPSRAAVACMALPCKLRSRRRF